jgi:hypothetical protein
MTTRLGTRLPTYLWWNNRVNAGAELVEATSDGRNREVPNLDPPHSLGNISTLG